MRKDVNKKKNCFTVKDEEKTEIMRHNETWKKKQISDDVQTMVGETTPPKTALQQKHSLSTLRL